MLWPAGRIAYYLTAAFLGHDDVIARRLGDLCSWRMFLAFITVAMIASLGTGLLAAAYGSI